MFTGKVFKSRYSLLEVLATDDQMKPTVTLEQTFLETFGMTLVHNLTKYITKGILRNFKWLKSSCNISYFKSGYVCTVATHEC